MKNSEMKIGAFTLPLPPTLNHMYQPVGNRLIKTSESKNWQVEAGYRIKQQRKSATPYDGIVEAIVHMYVKYDRDIDSSFKLLFDVLQYPNKMNEAGMGIIWNDRQIKKLTAEIHNVDCKPEMTVELLKYKQI